MMIVMEWQSENIGNGDFPIGSDNDGQRPPVADNGGHGRTVTNSDGQRPTMSSARKTEAHTMSSVDAARLFEKHGIPRSQRSIERYCKSGDLDSFFDPDVRQWFITPASVERLASYLREVAQKKGTTAPPTTGATEGDDGGAQRATSAGGELSNGTELEELRRHAKELEAKNRDLEIATRVKDKFIERLEQERERIIGEQHVLIERIEVRAHQVGGLEAKLHALEAPRQERPTHDDTPYQTTNDGS